MGKVGYSAIYLILMRGINFQSVVDLKFVRFGKSFHYSFFIGQEKTIKIVRMILIINLVLVYHCVNSADFGNCQNNHDCTYGAQCIRNHCRCSFTCTNYFVLPIQDGTIFWKRNQV